MLWPGVGEPFRVALIGLVQYLLPLLDDLARHAVMQHVRGQQGDSAMVMILVVPRKELLAKGACIFNGAEAVGEFGPVLQGLELALRVRVVIRDVRAAMGSGHPQIGHQQRHRL